MSSSAAKCWWVNHKQTFRQEFEGGYLWSPKTNAKGAVNQFYNNMRRAHVGDSVVSYADGRIRAIGIVTEPAITAPKPETFKTTGSYWSDTGWLLPVEWTPVAVEAKPKNYLDQLRQALPSKYSPLSDKTGDGNQGAYLSEISVQLFNLVLQWTSGTVGKVVSACDTASLIQELEDKESENIQKDVSLSETQRSALILARRGQGQFRESLIAQQSECIVTGVRNPLLLRASHIMPWRACTTGFERLDPLNGLLLTPSIDHLFDKGLISFADEGEIIYSSTLTDHDIAAFGLSKNTRSRISLDSRKTYLDFHRRVILVP
ncbi:MAG: HNH endonuclease [Mitsuaria chitosanitabida]|uniref:HNH endonuclease n=1 Tax=Roseateles chitosanitabidus TaxID=65048 RepID=UPI001B1F9ED5|nr:HNH endonuclease signature motif containing protein [Roseateles chitosanitabidus]MBO9686105.1 HNH endonuclease [Roseateles chitosanitabidus]